MLDVPCYPYGEVFGLKAGRYLQALLLCLCFITTSHLAFAQDEMPVHVLEGLVVGVAEGDRITVNSYGTEIHVRLYGVAAPQTRKLDKYTGWYKPGQPYSEEAFRALSSKILHQQVRIEIRRTLFSKDDPQQLALAIVYLDGRNINTEMLAEGWGWVYKRFMSRMDYAHYSFAERVARERKSGLWIQDHPQPPWEFKPELKARMKRSGS
jgi:micrococcal nuclease